MHPHGGGCRGPACLRTLVSASWTIRYADRSTPTGSGLGSPSNAKRHGDAGLADALGEGLQLAETGLRVDVLGSDVHHEHVEHPPQLDQALPARRLHGLEGAPGGRWVGVEHPARRLGLEHHDGERVRDEVVQLAGDPGPLLGDRRPGRLFLLARQGLCPVTELGHLAPSVGSPPAQSPGAREDEPAGQHLVDGVAVLQAGHVDGQHGGRQDGEPDAGRERPGVPPERVDHEQHGEPLGAAARRPGRHRPRTRPARRAAPRAASRAGDEHRERVQRGDQRR